MTPFVVLYLAIFGIFVILYGAQLTAVPFLLANEYQLSSAGIGLLVGLPAVTMGATAMQGDRVLRSLTSFQSIALGFMSYGPDSSSSPPRTPSTWLLSHSYCSVLARDSLNRLRILHSTNEHQRNFAEAS